MPVSELAPTRSVVLQLREEQDVVLEAYEFLDEKRLLLAAELLRQLHRYESLLQDYEVLRQQAERALFATIGRHGLQGAQVYPGRYLEYADMLHSKTLFMGVILLTTELQFPDEHTARPACNPSPEAEQCRRVFSDMLQLAAVLAGVSGNVHRLLEEYRRTERRARALENVVIPEIAQNLRELSAQLDEQEQEDIVRIHLKQQ